MLCPQTTECSAYSPQIRTNGELTEAYLQTQHHLDLCIIENSSLKKCMEEFNKKEQP
ncbi:Rz1-like lysis system protein LysC [Haemophilus influenzae]|uniref:Rz1-like lysis system protein LysC n=1 Tax=Haemophilus influenzae TaxID=727 RepID=UPI003D9FDA99